VNDDRDLIRAPAPDEGEPVTQEEIADLRAQVDALMEERRAGVPPRPSARVRRRRRENAAAVARKARRRHIRSQRRKSR
jgi:plasmid stabilization system protein ParE